MLHNRMIAYRLREFDIKGFPEGGEFEPCLGGVGNLIHKCQEFPLEHTWFFKIVLVWRISKAKKSHSLRSGFKLEGCQHVAAF